MDVCYVYNAGTKQTINTQKWDCHIEIMCNNRVSDRKYIQKYRLFLD